MQKYILGLIVLCAGAVYAQAPIQSYPINVSRTDNSSQFHIHSSVLNTPTIHFPLYQGTTAYEPGAGWGAYFKYGRSDSDPGMHEISATIVGSTVVVSVATNDFPISVNNWFAECVLTASVQAVSVRGQITIRRSPGVSAPGILSKTYSVNGSEYGPWTGSFSGWPFVEEGALTYIKYPTNTWTAGWTIFSDNAGTTTYAKATDAGLAGVAITNLASADGSVVVDASGVTRDLSVTQYVQTAIGGSTTISDATNDIAVLKSGTSTWWTVEDKLDASETNQLLYSAIASSTYVPLSHTNGLVSTGTFASTIATYVPLSHTNGLVSTGTFASTIATYVPLSHTNGLVSTGTFASTIATYVPLSHTNGLVSTGTFASTIATYVPLSHTNGLVSTGTLASTISSYLLSATAASTYAPTSSYGPRVAVLEGYTSRVVAVEGYTSRAANALSGIVSSNGTVSITTNGGVVNVEALPAANYIINNTGTNVFLYSGTGIVSVAGNTGSVVRGVVNGYVGLSNDLYGAEISGDIPGGASATIYSRSHGAKILVDFLFGGEARIAQDSSGAEIRGFINDGISVIGSGSPGATRIGQTYSSAGTTIGNNAAAAFQVGTANIGSFATNDASNSIQLFVLGSGERAVMSGAADGSIGIGPSTVNHKHSIVVGTTTSRADKTISASGAIYSDTGFIGDMSGGTNFPSTLRTIAAESAFNTNLVKILWGAPTGVTQAVDTDTRFSFRIPTNAPATNIYIGAANMGGTGTNWGRLPVIYTVP